MPQSPTISISLSAQQLHTLVLSLQCAANEYMALACTTSSRQQEQAYRHQSAEMTRMASEFQTAIDQLARTQEVAPF
jgi:hypothetical protein